MPNNILSCAQFTQFLVDEQPNYDKYIIKDVRPTDGWIAHVATGVFEAWTGTQHTRDRFNSVYPNVTNAWNPVTSAGCLGTPCDPSENLLGWGSTRLVYGLEQQSWATQLLCFDQEMHITQARQQWSYIISDILKPATSYIQSNYLRKRAAQLVDNKYVANRYFGTTASTFVFTWVPVAGQEIYIDTNTPPTSVFKLTPQMLQRLVEPLIRIGYLGKNPFSETRPPMLELVTDTETTWELDRLGGTTGVGGTPSVVSNWRFESWDIQSKYWTYGFTGQLGNYAIRTDPMGLRFNYVGVVAGNYRYQVVLPYKNIASSGAGSAPGLKSISNSDYDNAQFGFSYVWHPKVMEFLSAQAQPVNPEMPFASRNFGGKWQFVMNNLGADINGCVIENKRGNKGQFIGDFKQAAAPDHTEWGVLIFHKREPACVTEINTCNADPGYPTQSYSSANTACADETSTGPSNTTIAFTATLNTSLGVYWVEANSAICEGGPIQHQEIRGGTTTAELVVLLNQYLGVMGTWARASASTVTLTGTCSTASLPFAV